MLIGKLKKEVETVFMKGQVQTIPFPCTDVILRKKDGTTEHLSAPLVFKTNVNGEVSYIIKLTS